MNSGERERLDFRVQYRQSNAEQEEARCYVLNKYMQRPKTNWVTVFLMLLLYGFVCGGISWGIIRWLGASSMLCGWLITLVWVAAGLATVRRFLIKLVECYQHYAKEETRRRCLCKPTCSEYAIAVLRKNFLPHALYRIWKRLFRTCKDGQYKIDLP